MPALPIAQSGDGLHAPRSAVSVHSSAGSALTGGGIGGIDALSATAGVVTDPIPAAPDVADTEAIIWQGRYELAMREANSWRAQTGQFQLAARMILALRCWTVPVPAGECASAYEHTIDSPAPVAALIARIPRQRTAPSGVPTRPRRVARP